MTSKSKIFFIDELVALKQNLEFLKALNDGNHRLKHKNQAFSPSKQRVMDYPVPSLKIKAR